MSLYGKPTLHVEDDTTDRIGIRTLVLAQIWQPPTQNASVLDLDAAEPPPPPIPGGLWLIGRQRKPIRGGFKTFWTYEGINGDGKDVTFKDRSNSPDYSFEPGFAQCSIIMHPSFDQLASTFNGQVLDGQVVWPQWLPGGTENGAVKDDSDGKVNPMFGRQDFYSMQGTYHFRYASLTLGQSQNGIGQIAGALPGQPPSFPDRNWLKAPAPWQRRGPVIDITEVYWLSDQGGWPKEIYSAASMTGDFQDNSDS